MWAVSCWQSRHEAEYRLIFFCVTTEFWLDEWKLLEQFEWRLPTVLQRCTAVREAHERCVCLGNCRWCHSKFSGKLQYYAFGDMLTSFHILWRHYVFGLFCLCVHAYVRAGIWACQQRHSLTGLPSNSLVAGLYLCDKNNIERWHLIQSKLCHSDQPSNWMWSAHDDLTVDYWNNNGIFNVVILTMWYFYMLDVLCDS